ncbi:MAG: hypothetical protein WEA56_01500 [Balneolaceae bacterium]
MSISDKTIERGEPGVEVAVNGEVNNDKLSELIELIELISTVSGIDDDVSIGIGRIPMEIGDRIGL